MLPGAEGRRNGGGLLFYGYRVLVWDDKKVLEMDNGNRYITIWMYLMSLSCIPKNGENVKFYVFIHTHTHIYVFMTIKKYKIVVHHLKHMEALHALRLLDPHGWTTEHSHRVLKGGREDKRGRGVCHPSSCHPAKKCHLLHFLSSKSSHSSLGFPIFQFQPFIVSYIVLCEVFLFIPPLSQILPWSPLEVTS